MRRAVAIAAVAMSLFLIAQSAWAATFDPSTGTGFASAPEIRAALQLSSRIFNASAADFTFTYEVQQPYSTTCSDPAGDDNVLVITHTDIASSLVYVTNRRGRTKLSGFEFNGLGSSTSDGTAPQVGDPCGSGGTVTDVTQDSSAAYALVHWGERAALFWPCEGGCG